MPDKRHENKYRPWRCPPVTTPFRSHLFRRVTHRELARENTDVIAYRDTSEHLVQVIDSAFILNS